MTRYLKLMRVHHYMKNLLVFAALIVIYIGKNIYDIWSFSTVDQKCRADVAVILGAAVYDDEPSPVYRDRNHRERPSAHETGNASGGGCGDQSIQFTYTLYEIRQPAYKNPVSCKRNILLYRISVVSIIFLRNRIADISQRVLLLYRN